MNEMFDNRRGSYNIKTQDLEQMKAKVVRENGGGSCQLHPGTRIRCYRCSLPGLAGFTVYRRGGTNTSCHS